MPYDQEPKDKPEHGSKDKKKAEGKSGGKEEKFPFLQETIKPKPISREKILMQFARISIYGLIFGFFACCSFFALKPWAENTFFKDETKVTIPADEDEEQEEAPEEQVEAPAAAVELNSGNYEEMMDSLYDIAKEADKSIVSVQAVKKDDWAANAENMQSAAGVIVADNGRELLVLADSAICEDASQWSVTFADNKEYGAALKKQDKNRGLAVFGIEHTAVADSTENAIKTATLGNSNNCKQGEVVIALGNMFGYGDGLSYGIISSKSYESLFSDSMCGVIATDIPLTEGGTGILINLDGEVLGLIRAQIWEDTESTTANALSISDLKPVLELLLNGESVPYIGANGTTVTEDISGEQGIPVGIYVTNVEADSPAMAAGIQNGDVIQEIDGIKVTGNSSYAKAVEQCRAGDAIKICGQRRGTGGYVEVTFNVTVGSRE